MKVHSEITDSVRNLASRAPGPRQLMEDLVQLLRRERPYYNWAGSYLMNGTRELVPGPFADKPSAHARIPLHQGICGAAASIGETLIVDDVSSDARYLACGVETKSEIVVPIKREGEVMGEINMDSDALAAFGERDRQLLEDVAEIVAGGI